MVEILVGVLGGAHLVDGLPHGGGRRVREEIGLIREAAAVERGIETTPPYDQIEKRARCVKQNRSQGQR